GSLIAGTRNNPIGTTGLGPYKTHSHVLTITLYGPDPGKGGKGATCRSTNCGVPAGAFDNVVALPGMPAGYTDKLIKYDPLFADDGDPNAYFGNKVLGVSYGGTLMLFGAKGAAKDPAIDALPTNSFNSWRRLDASLSAKDTLLSADQAIVNGATQAIGWE